MIKTMMAVAATMMMMRTTITMPAIGPGGNALSGESDTQQTAC